MPARALRAALVVSLLLAGCGRGEDRPIPILADDVGGSWTVTAFPSPPFVRTAADALVSVEMREFRIVVDPPLVTGPKVYFLVSNRGRLDHEFRLVAPDDESGEVVVITPPLERDGYAEVGVELSPGRYLLRCELPLADETHAELGMVAELTVAAEPDV